MITKKRNTERIGEELVTGVLLLVNGLRCIKELIKKEEKFEADPAENSPYGPLFTALNEVALTCLCSLGEDLRSSIELARPADGIPLKVLTAVEVLDKLLGKLILNLAGYSSYNDLITKELES
jgi:hypothetical protein